MKLLAPCLAALFIGQSFGAEMWSIRLEEPTGLYPRTNELIGVPFEKIGGRATGWQVVDAQGKEQPWQATEKELLFPGTLIPGELPEYRVIRMAVPITNFVSQVHARKIGMNRLELGNRFFRVLLDTHSAAFLEAFNLTADTYRTLNLVETTPEDPAALKDDIHAAEAMGFKPVPGVPEGNNGWTTLGGTGPIEQIDLVETGPLRARVRLVRSNEIWELICAADSRALLWRVHLRSPPGTGSRDHAGFRFTAISAVPFLPFNRFLDGSEYHWPNGPDDEEPPNHDIQPRPWPKLPGGHAVYYRDAENYGALGIVALDTNLNWAGIGSRRFIAELPLVQSSASATTEIALTFPEWRGSNTVLEARREYRVLKQPLLFQVSRALNAGASIQHPAERQAEMKLLNASEIAGDFKPDSQSLDGEWELAWCEKGAGPPTNGWRRVKVPVPSSRRTIASRGSSI